MVIEMAEGTRWRVPAKGEFSTKYALKYDVERKYVMKGSDIYTTTSLTKARKTAREIISRTNIKRIWVEVLDKGGDWCDGIVTFDKSGTRGIGWVYIPYFGNEAFCLKADGTVKDFTQPLKVKRAEYLVEKTWGN